MDTARRRWALLTSVIVISDAPTPTMAIVAASARLYTACATPTKVVRLNPPSPVVKVTLSAGLPDGAQIVTGLGVGGSEGVGGPGAGANVGTGSDAFHVKWPLHNCPAGQALHVLFNKYSLVTLHAVKL